LAADLPPSGDVGAVPDLVLDAAPKTAVNRGL
jgi:hypothetical protein